MGFLDALEPERSTPVSTGPKEITQSYADTAIRNACAEVRQAPEGQRNTQLNNSMHGLRGLIAAGILDEAYAVDQLTDAARIAGLDEDEIPNTIRSALSSSKPYTEFRLVEPRGVVEYPSDQKVAQNPTEGAGMALLKERLLSPRGLRTLPEPSPLIDNVLDQGTTALLYGKWGSSKSFIALDWACSVATGRSWQGRATKRAKVLYVVAEGVAGFAGRLDAWELGWQTSIDDEWMRFLPMPINLMTSDVNVLVDEVQSGGYGFVIFDTLARCMVGADENSARDAGIAVDSLAKLMYATPDHRGVVLGVHHTGKDGKTLRGSSAFEGGVDTVYFAERDGQCVSLRRTKRKDGPESDVHRLRLSTMPGTDSCVVEAAPEKDVADSDSIALLKKIFQMFIQTGVSNTDLKTLALENGMSFSTYSSARATLLAEGWMVNTGSGARPFFEAAAGAKTWRERVGS